MKAHEILGSKTIEVLRGTNLGIVIGLLLDADTKRVLALGVHAGGLLTHARYVAFGDVISIENDVVTIPAKESLLDRDSFRTADILESVKGRQVITEDGRELGELLDYDVEPKTGRIISMTFAPEQRALGGLIKKAGDRYDVPVELIKTIGENVVVDKSTPDVVGFDRAA